MAGNGEVDDGPPLTELESLQLKANQVTDESLDSTRRMIQLCEDSQAAGTKTLDQLDRQGEQLNRIETGMDEMNAEMKQAEKHITGMEKWCGICVCPWNRTRKVRDTDGTWKKPKEDSSSSKAVKGQPKASKAGAVPDGPYIQRINNDAREDEMEENMEAVGNILGNLKSMASDMGNEISKQNDQIDRVTMKSQGVDSRIAVANKRTEKLLK